jgi:hypothetical protein
VILATNVAKRIMEAQKCLGLIADADKMAHGAKQLEQPSWIMQFTDNMKNMK